MKEMENADIVEAYIMLIEYSWPDEDKQRVEQLIKQIESFLRSTGINPDEIRGCSAS